ncbi:DUF305 domain-containing protein [Arthrobacter sp. PsM3]|uniref:DUF305 domain-containing protein n=1 Tax=Arthrobacter sp. PsM3 TaxID=3030531 RepID=UPI00263BD816|nr:DUF305 domain-containing protein [Arthrobacter sp. PsM3]MDN4643952.1 DUF305 domain-containing protein [Arthrobacter sp. PsM3]
MKKFLTISATALAAAIALAGCSAGSGGSMPAMNMGGSGTSTDSAPIAAGDHNGADTTFAQMMIPHHTQAVEMSDLILKKQGIDPKVTALAVKIKAEQAPEITTITGWLKQWNEPSQMSGSGMSGAMSSDDMTKLDAAQGAEAAKLYLSQMITHHQGAVTMAQTEEATGKNTDTVTLSKNIVTSQEAEIQEMKNLLATL